jgi:DNA-binding MarR family transcriptional regulator
MPTFAEPSNNPDAVMLLQRIIHLRSHFKLVLPENISELRKKIQNANLSGKGPGINDASLFYLVGNVFTNHPEPISMGELSRDLEVPLSTATRTMDWMVNNGYAQRLPDPNDRRIVRVELTEAGKAVYLAISTFMLERVKQALSQLAPDERDTLIELLNKVLNAFEQAA